MTKTRVKLRQLTVWLSILALIFAVVAVGVFSSSRDNPMQTHGFPRRHTVFVGDSDVYVNAAYDYYHFDRYHTGQAGNYTRRFADGNSWFAVRVEFTEVPANPFVLLRTGGGNRWVGVLAQENFVAPSRGANRNQWTTLQSGFYHGGAPGYNAAVNAGDISLETNPLYIEQRRYLLNTAATTRGYWQFDLSDFNVGGGEGQSLVFYLAWGAYMDAGHGGVSYGIHIYPDFEAYAGDADWDRAYHYYGHSFRRSLNGDRIINVAQDDLYINVHNNYNWYAWRYGAYGGNNGGFRPNGEFRQGGFWRAADRYHLLVFKISFAETPANPFIRFGLSGDNRWIGMLGAEDAYDNGDFIAPHPNFNQFASATARDQWVNDGGTWGWDNSGVWHTVDARCRIGNLGYRPQNFTEADEINEAAFFDGFYTYFDVSNFVSAANNYTFFIAFGGMVSYGHGPRVDDMYILSDFEVPQNYVQTWAPGTVMISSDNQAVDISQNRFMRHRQHDNYHLYAGVPSRYHGNAANSVMRVRFETAPANPFIRLQFTGHNRWMGIRCGNLPWSDNVRPSANPNYGAGLALRDNYWDTLSHAGFSERNPRFNGADNIVLSGGVHFQYFDISEWVNEANNYTFYLGFATMLQAGQGARVRHLSFLADHTLPADIDSEGLGLTTVPANGNLSVNVGNPATLFQSYHSQPFIDGTGGWPQNNAVAGYRFADGNQWFALRVQFAEAPVNPYIRINIAGANRWAGIIEEFPGSDAVHPYHVIPGAYGNVAVHTARRALWTTIDSPTGTPTGRDNFTFGDYRYIYIGDFVNAANDYTFFLAFGAYAYAGNGARVNSLEFISDFAFLQSIAVTTEPTTEFRLGEAFNSTGLVITGTFAGHPTLTTAILTGFEVTPPASALATGLGQAVTVTYVRHGVERTVSYNINVREVTGIALAPTTDHATEFPIGGTFTAAGMVVRLALTGGTVHDVAFADFANYGITVSTPDMTQNITRAVTVTLNSVWSDNVARTVAFNIQVGEGEPVLTSLTLSETTLFFILGDTFSFGNLVVTAVFTQSYTRNVTAEAGLWSTTTPDMSAGTRSITATYTYGGETVTATLNIVVRTVLRIEIETMPTVTSVPIGSTFSQEGLTVRVVLSDDDYYIISEGFTVTWPLTTTAGNRGFTVAYNRNGAVTPALTVDRLGLTVTAPTPTLVSIAITTQPSVTSFTVGDAFSHAGLVVTATLSDNTTVAVTGFTVSAPDMTTAGTRTVTITYIRGEITQTATFTITVAEEETPPYDNGGCGGCGSSATVGGLVALGLLLAVMTFALSVKKGRE